MNKCSGSGKGAEPCRRSVIKPCRPADLSPAPLPRACLLLSRGVDAVLTSPFATLEYSREKDIARSGDEMDIDSTVNAGDEIVIQWATDGPLSNEFYECVVMGRRKGAGKDTFVVMHCDRWAEETVNLLPSSRGSSVRKKHARTHALQSSHHDTPQNCCC
jgi:hypothetical protein